MNIAVFTTWNQVCGIGDYSMSLYNQFPKEHTIKIIAPELNGLHHSLKPVLEDEGPHEVIRCWNATIWDNIVKIDAQKIDEVARWADVVHIQFQDALFHHEWFLHILERIKPHTKLVVTLHDTCLGKIWPLLTMFDHVFTMKPEVKSQVPQAELIHMPIYDNPPVLKGFGLGRSKHDNIKKVCDELGYIYEYKHAENEWLPINLLIQWLRDSDGVVLYYDEVSTAGSSAAARTALSTRRPVFVNNVTWFNDIDEKAVRRFEGDDGLREALKAELQRPYNTKSSYSNLVSSHLKAYSK